MRTYIIFLLIFFASAFAGADEKVVLKDGKEINTDYVVFDGGKIKLADGNILSIKEIKQIFFNVAPKKTLEEKVEEKNPVASDIKEIITTAQEYASKYKDAGFVYLLDDGVYEYNDDHTSSYTYHCQGLICKETHKDYGIGGTYFTEGREKAELIMARTIKNDGTVIPFDNKNIIIAKPSQKGDTFTAGSTFIFQLPDIEVGSIIEYKYKKTTYKPAKKEFFFPKYNFQGVDPVKLSRCKVIIPKDMEFYYEAKNFPENKGKPQINIENGKKVYTWQMEDPPLIVSEPSMPHLDDVAIFLYGSIFKDWNVVFDWLEEYYSKNCIPSEKLKNFTLDLVKECRTQEEKVAAIYHWIQQNIRYIIIKGDLSSTFGSYKCDITFNRKFGCCVDKAVLFSGMLNAVGIKSTPVLLNTTGGEDVSVNIPRIYLEHAINCVYLDNKKIYLDSTGYDSRYPSFSVEDQGVWCLNPLERKVEYIPQGEPDSTMAKYITVIDMDKEGNCHVNWRTAYQGEYETWIRGYWKSVKESKRKQLFEQMCNQIFPNTKLINYKLENLLDISKPFWMSTEYMIYGYPAFASDLIIFSLPIREHDFSELRLAKRNYDLEYHYPFMKQNEVVINLPPGMKVLFIPQPMKINHKYFTYEAQYTMLGDKKISFTDTYKRKCRYVRVNEYEEYRNLHMNIERYGREKIFLKFTNEGEGK